MEKEEKVTNEVPINKESPKVGSRLNLESENSRNNGSKLNSEPTAVTQVSEPIKSESPIVSKILPLPEERLPKLEELLQAGVHFGHQKGRWDPAARSFIFGERNGVHIINLRVTLKHLELALDKIKEIISNNGKVLFVGTKRQVKDLVAEAAKITNMPFVTERWLGGTFTNFTTMNRRIQKLLDIERRSEEGALNHYTKKEQMKFKKLIRDFEKNMGGIKNLTDLPNAIFVIGVKEEKTAVAEANKTGVKVIAIADTNINPKNIDYPIPGNDDAVKSTRLILKYIVREIMEVKK